jgi:hypothetical protein
MFNNEAYQQYLNQCREQNAVALNVNDWVRQQDAPPIAGAADREYRAKIDAAATTAEFATKSARRLDSGKQPITDSPLFGGPSQLELF